MMIQKSINWGFIARRTLRILRITQIILGFGLLLDIIYISFQKGFETGSGYGLLLWVVVGIVFTVVLGALLVGMELLLYFTSKANEWLVEQFGRHIEMRRRILTVAALIFFLLPFALVVSPGFWIFVTDNLLRVIILASFFTFSSALLAVVREQRIGNYASRFTLLESTLSNHVPLLTDDQIAQAIKMAEVYVVLHCYENSVRKLIETVLSRELGKDWWSLVASDVMKRNADNRQQTEQNRRWISPRGANSPLYYLEWSDLEKLIRKYEKLFLPYIGELRFVESRFGDLESLRNLVAHNGILPSNDDFQRVRLSFSDWNRQVGKALDDLE